MGINSQEVSYGFGQLGSAYTDLAQTIIPPKDHVIVAIQFLAQNTPTVLTPEKLDEGGPGFPEITTGSNTTAIAADDIILIALEKPDSDSTEAQYSLTLEMQET